MTVVRGVDPHLSAIRPVTPTADGCEDCLRTGGVWVHLRLCLTCGHVGCCDSSPNRHARKQFHATGHPIVQSFEPGEDWRWCYVHEALVRRQTIKRTTPPSTRSAAPVVAEASGDAR
jgi:uncharacterized UBP type Zn finger protein